YANRSLLDAGARLAFGSDWSVAPLDPLLGIDAAVNRRTLDGKHRDGWFPEQKIRVDEAVEAYTLGSAYAAFQEKDRGTLEVGKCIECQRVLVALLADTPLTLLNPRRRDYPDDDPIAEEAQITWEHRHIRRASAAAFWFPSDTLCPITLYELGAFSMTRKPLF